MDPRRVGSDIRLLRRQRGWAQARLAATAGVSAWAVYRIEGGHADAVLAGTLTRVVAALDGYLSVRVLWHGEGLDRLRDRRHAALVERIIGLLREDGWIVEPEVSFNRYGERGSIDVLALHPASGALLVVEVKTVIPDVGGMLATLDRKARLAPGIAAQRGWAVRSVSRLLVVPEASTARRRVGEHAATFAAALPARNVVVRRWLRLPAGRLAGILFLSDPRPDTGTRPSRPAAEDLSGPLRPPGGLRTASGRPPNGPARSGEAQIPPCSVAPHGRGESPHGSRVRGWARR